MKALKTYTPTNFRKHCYDLFNQVKDDKNYIQVTVRNNNGKPNSDILLINKSKYLQILKENKKLKQEKLDDKLNSLTKKMSSNPVIKTPKQLDKWFDKNND